MTTSLELAEVVRKTANLGASYPQIVAVLENGQAAEKSRRRAGRRRRARSNRVYLEAILGKDTTAKRDDSVKRTSAENSEIRPALAVWHLRTR